MTDINCLVTNWNRPKHTKKCIDNLINLGVENIFVSIDGPRKNNSDDKFKIQEIVDYLEDLKKNKQISIKILKHKNNLGCRYAMQNSINWFFENVQDGIIIEDDILINKSFLNFSRLLLDKYRYNYSIGAITANNVQPMWRKYKYDYFFSIFPHCWGWATWSDRWLKFDDSMKLWPKIKKENLNFFFRSNSKFKKYWLARFDSVYNREIDSWATIWTYSLWSNKMLTCAPPVNMGFNQGFGFSGRKDGTHSKISIQKNLKEYIFCKLPPKIIYCEKNDKYDQETNYQPNILRRISRKILRRRLFL